MLHRLDRRLKEKNAAASWTEIRNKARATVTLYGWDYTTPVAFHTIPDFLKGSVRVDGIDLENRCLIGTLGHFFHCIQSSRLLMGSLFNMEDINLSRNWGKS